MKVVVVGAGWAGLAAAMGLAAGMPCMLWSVWAMAGAARAKVKAIRTGCSNFFMGLVSVSWLETVRAQVSSLGPNIKLTAR